MESLGRVFYCDSGRLIDVNLDRRYGGGGLGLCACHKSVEMV